jgi:hypothetical protein
VSSHQNQNQFNELATEQEPPTSLDEMIDQTTTISPPSYRMRPDRTRWESACGDFADEKIGLAFFDQLVESTGLFAIHREVDGWLLHTLPRTEEKTVRIDRILMPSKKLLEAGWTHGYIGVEGKKPGEKMGAAIAQADDYMRSAFISPVSGGRILLNWCVLYPFEYPSGPTESVLAQNRLATCSPFDRHLTFKSSAKNLLNTWDGKIDIKPADTIRKVGCR